MMDLEKKKKNDDLPANQPPVKAQQLLKSAREPTDKGKGEMKSAAELEEMKKRLAVTADSQKRKMLLETIQERFGNRMAEKVVTELRLQKDEKKETKKE